MTLTGRDSTLRQAALDASLRLHAQIEDEFALRPGIARATTLTGAEDEVRATGETFYA